MASSRPDVIFDCNIFLQAITRSSGPAAQVLRLVDHSAINLHISKAILAEVRRTLHYPELRERNPHLTENLIEAYIRRVIFRGVVSRKVPHVFEFPRDPHDEPYIDLAALVSADFLVTRDNDLLSLMTDHSTEAKQFRQRFPKLSIVDPVEFLREMRRRGAK